VVAGADLFSGLLDPIVVGRRFDDARQLALPDNRREFSVAAQFRWSRYVADGVSV